MAVVRKQGQVLSTSSDDPKGTILSGESAPSGGITLHKKTKKKALVQQFDLEITFCHVIPTIKIINQK